MSVPKMPSEGGSGGKRGHSNMEHWVHTDETKEAARHVRRLEAKRAVRDGLQEANLPAEPDEESGSSKPCRD